ncbi:hypothetical protein ACHAWO_003618 [Cyclotella atomus]|uniref:Methyltransferase domain-containing protein n=1 Tax=Cyclotella atomus TaxID=382360 RepID=A0ABD3P3G5_9STRA
MNHKLITIASLMVINTIDITTALFAGVAVRSCQGRRHKSSFCRLILRERCARCLHASNGLIEKNTAASIHQQLVIFRPPSRHTYGFVDDESNYDLPQLELGALIHHICETAEFEFVPVIQREHVEQRELHDVAVQGKIRSRVQKSSLKVQSLYWMNGNISLNVVAMAASKAILTHATLLINASYEFTQDEWNAADNFDDAKYQELLGTNVDVIDMTNANLGIQQKNSFLQRVAFLFHTRELPFITDLDDPIILHHVNESDIAGTIHYIHFGKRIAIGPAGTKGAPSQTLRRTHRGLLREYAIKNRMNEYDAGDFARSNISTAMEPEIGFLMANLALAGSHDSSGSIRFLDPCCGSGSLLLYSAALGATQLVGVDSNPSVWIGADAEFENHGHANPNFIEGDVFNPTKTIVLSTSDSFDAIVCDPPYNIGAPVFIDKKDSRPRNRFRDHNETNNISTTNEINNSDDVTQAILLLAGNVLVNRGRVVFFLPVKGKTQTPCAIKQYDDMLQSANLSLVFERKQQFTSTFSRWLVCLEKT